MKCNELKAYIAPTADGMGLEDYYLKSEADKVIADLEEKTKQYKVLYQEKCRDINTQERFFAQQIAHHKYKRCLDKARMCEERYCYLTSLENYQMTDKEYRQVIGDYWDRWHKRWLKIAELFKEAK